jgi:hypothetical protein
MDGNDRSIAAFTMLGHGLVHWFEMSIPIFLVAWGSAFDASLVLRRLVVALGYAPLGLTLRRSWVPAVPIDRVVRESLPPASHKPRVSATLPPIFRWRTEDNHARPYERWTA